jgi:thioredoxin reductase
VLGFWESVRGEILRYPSIELRDAEVESLSRNGGRFAFVCADGTSGVAATALIATGLVDTLPRIPRIEDFYGVSVHHCIYCDGAEYAGQPLVAYGEGDKGAALALMMSHWSPDIVACCGETAPTPAWEKRLFKHNIEVIHSNVTRLLGGPKLQAVVFENGLTRDSRFLAASPSFSFCLPGSGEHTSPPRTASLNDVAGSSSWVNPPFGPATRSVREKC